VLQPQSPWSTHMSGTRIVIPGLLLLACIAQSGRGQSAQLSDTSVMSGYSNSSSFTPAAFTPLDVATGDVDNDGDLDVAVADRSGGGVRLFLNMDYPPPTFPPFPPLGGEAYCRLVDVTATNVGSVSNPTLLAASCVAFVDVDNDNDLDIVEAADGSG